MLRDADIASRCWVFIKDHASGAIAQGRPLKVSVSMPADSRSLEQNAMLHALLGQVAAQKEWAGQRWDIEDWKRLLTAAWMRTRNENAVIVPALDGGGRFDVLYRRTSELSRSECGELIDYISAWAAENGVQLKEHP